MALSSQYRARNPEHRTECYHDLKGGITGVVVDIDDACNQDAYQHPEENEIVEQSGRFIFVHDPLVLACKYSLFFHASRPGPSLKNPETLEGPGEKLRTFLEKSQNPGRSRRKTTDLP